MTKGKIRVLHVTNSLNYGGLERVAIDICRYLDPVEFAPMVACIKWKGPQAKLLEDVGIPVVTLKKEKTNLSKYATFFELKRVIKNHGIDVVHSHNTGPLLDVIAARLISLSFPKIIHTDHTRGCWPDKKKYMIFERIASMFVHSMIAVSEEAKEKLIHFEHIQPQRIEIINNGIPVEKFQEHINSGNDVKEELKLDQFEQVIGLCVVHRKQKGIAHLLNALPIIVKLFPKLVCVIGGSGPEQEALVALASTLGIQENIRFIGPRDDVERILPIFDVYILPSEWEGLPLSLLEAMAAQRCIVATRVGAVPKALENGKCGMLVPPKDSASIADAVIGLLQSPRIMAGYAAEAYRSVNEIYSARKMTRSYSLRYKQSLGLL